MEEDDDCMAFPIQLFQDGGYMREIVQTYDKWSRVLSEFKRSRGWEEGEDHNLSEEEYNC